MSLKHRLDTELVTRGLVATRSQAESYIRLGKVRVNGKSVLKTGQQVGEQDRIVLDQERQYVSRAALKLESAAHSLGLSFTDMTVLDVGSSTGGFTHYALEQGAMHVTAVDVGTDQLHPSLRADDRITLYEKTDIRSVGLDTDTTVMLAAVPDIILVDVSFISLKMVLPHIAGLMDENTMLVAMCKPQFEAGKSLLNKGVIKNDTLRRRVLQEFEAWLKPRFVIIKKADSTVSGEKGNTERFYLLRKAAVTPGA